MITAVVAVATGVRQGAEQAKPGEIAATEE